MVFFQTPLLVNKLMGKKSGPMEEDIWLYGFLKLKKYFNQLMKEKDISTLLDNWNQSVVFDFLRKIELYDLT